MSNKISGLSKRSLIRKKEILYGESPENFAHEDTLFTSDVEMAAPMEVNNERSENSEDISCLFSLCKGTVF